MRATIPLTIVGCLLCQQLVQILCRPPPMILVSKEMIENFEKVEQYLEENVHSEEPEANVIAMRRLVTSIKEQQPGDEKHPLAEAFEILATLDLIDLSPSGNPLGYGILDYIDRALRNKRRLSGGNYPLKRIDRILEHYAIKQFEKSDVTTFTDSFDLILSFKRNMFREINKYLIDNEKTSDVEANMAKASELLEQTLKETVEGALTEALRLFISLKSLLNEDMCKNEQGYLISLKNYLTIPYEDREYSENRIGKLIEYYLLEHAELCRSAYPEIFTQSIQQFDLLTMNSLRVLLSESLLDHQGSLANETSQLQFRENFTTPELNVWLEEHINDETKSARNDVKVNSPKSMSRAVRALLSGETPLVSDGAGELYEKYLVSPCQRYLDTCNRVFVHLTNHWVIYFRIKVLDDYFDEMEKNLPKYSGMLLGRIMAGICYSITSDRARNIESLKVALKD